MAGATTPQQQTVAALERAIREAGRDPVQRDSYYRHITASRNGSMPGAPSADAELPCM
jgi:aminodeoxyfutalosine synthase